MRVAYSTHSLFPIEVLQGFIHITTDGESLEVETNHPLTTDWGEMKSQFTDNEDVYNIQVSEICYLSLIEESIYSIKLDMAMFIKSFVSENKFLNIDNIQNIIVGFSPYGGISIWLGDYKKQILGKWLKAPVISCQDIEIEQDDLKSVCETYINGLHLTSAYLDLYGLPPRDLFDNYMKQFIYRFIVHFEKWNEDDKKWTKYTVEEILPEYDYIEEMLYDGTFDKLHDGGLLKYHEAGKPKKLALSWHIKKSEYSAYFWFDEDEIRTVFDRFYGMHPDTKTDFIIRIDPEKRRYELSLYRYGLKEPQIIPESAYQLIVFKNQFEDYRSDNYSQERGAWIW